MRSENIFLRSNVSKNLAKAAKDARGGVKRPKPWRSLWLGESNISIPYKL